ncbi:MAG TPA: ATP synthase F1 subunit epsilon [Candidatus Saccharimonadales bacterium]|nr:ATP synthase F1 subunit epsilon [Candidatus Saccharimonadales bacterium]
MAELFHLSVLTPEEKVFEQDVVCVTAPGAQGYLGVLAHHAALITPLVPGKLSIRLADGAVDDYAVSGGFLQVGDNRATVLADACEHVGDIDMARALEAEKRARQLLEERGEHFDRARAEAALSRAINRVRLGNGHSQVR